MGELEALQRKLQAEHDPLARHIFVFAPALPDDGRYQDWEAAPGSGDVEFSRGDGTGVSMHSRRVGTAALGRGRAVT